MTLKSKGKMTHHVDTTHTYAQGSVLLVSESPNRLRLSDNRRNVSRCPNAMDLDRSQVNDVIALLTVWRDEK